MIKFLNKRGYYVVKVSLCNKPGFPDLSVCEGRGVVSYIEVKRPGETADPLQLIRHDELREYGHTITVADCISDIDHLYPKR